jgi:hypothetical protein
MSSSETFSASAATDLIRSELPYTLDDDWNAHWHELETTVGAFPQSHHGQGHFAETKMEEINSGTIFAPDAQYLEGKEEWGWNDKVGHIDPTFEDFSAWQPTTDLTQMILSQEAITSGFDIRLDDDIYVNANKNSALNVFEVRLLMRFR